MKVIHLISGGDTGGAKTHIHTLLQGLNRHIQADMVCFTDGPFTQEARELGIHTDVLTGILPNLLKALRDKIRQGGYDIIHCHGSRGNLMGALLKRSTGLPLVSTLHSDPKIPQLRHPEQLGPAADPQPHRRVPAHGGSAHRPGVRPPGRV